MSESDEEEIYRASCYDCNFTPTNSHLPRHPVVIEHEDGISYDEVPVPLCERCSPGGLATYWTRDLEEHLVSTPAE